MSKKRVPKLADLIIVHDVQAGLCAAIVVGVDVGGTVINAAGWTPNAQTRVYSGIRRMDDMGRPPYDSGWRWPDEYDK